MKKYSIIWFIGVVILILPGIVMVRKVTTKKHLEAYKKKRNFEKTPEPSGARGIKPSLTKPHFVIQKHAASHLHYDFRLEIDGVLVSWAVPKGPTMDPHVKHLAMQTEDHPLDYYNFEGVIPPKNYGAGTVMVWDYGTYKNIKKDKGKIVPMKTCLEEGQIEIWLDGKKLHGGFVLIEFRPKEKAWLLKKIDDDKANAHINLIKTDPDSALSGRTMSEIKEWAENHPDAVWK